MSTWTTAARAELDRYFSRLAPTLKTSGADPAEVLEDLRQHLQREADAARLEVVTEDDVRRLLARIGAPQPESKEPASASPAASPRGPSIPAAPGSPVPDGLVRPDVRGPGIWLLLLSVVLPAITWGIELATGMCAAAFFDPIPTLGHQILLAAVPAVNLVTWTRARSSVGVLPSWIIWANSVVIGVTLFYSLQFLPLLLPGLVAIVFFGLGLLPWAPILGLVSTVGLRRHLRRLSTERGIVSFPRLWPGALAAVGVLLLFDGAVWITRVGLDRAGSSEPEVRRQGLSLLRRLGHHDTLLRACYGRTRRAAQMDLLQWVLTSGRDVPPERAREIYYRVIGQPFNAVPPPVVRTGRGALVEFDEWTWDAEQGGEQVGGRIRGLSLNSSRLDATVEADAALVYCEWMLEFRNLAERPHEARGQILLPPGGVVSRLTLWVNGEECEAAFSSRSRTRQAYQSVAIRQRRDPVLVTTSGPDRVLVQCFPVPPNGGTIKIRLGITAPLHLRDAAQGTFHWPRFLERNFSVTDGFRHTLWLDSNDALALSSSNLAAQAGEQADPKTLRGDLAESDLLAGVGRVRVQRNPEIRQVWAADPRAESPHFVRGRLVETQTKPVPQLVLVLDGSVGLRGAMPAVAAAVTALPDNVGLHVILARDEPEALAGGQSLPPREVARLLASSRFEGGQDNTAGLVQAWDLAARSGSAVVWIHGPQPVQLGPVEALRQRCERSAAGPVVHSFLTRPGPDRLLEALDDLPRVQSACRGGSVEDDLNWLFARLVKPAATFSMSYHAEAGASPKEPSVRGPVSLHLVRLWANDSIRRLRASRQPDDAGQALQIAARYQLVTPISGAVVLETEEQFRQFDLQAAAKGTTPTMPSPGLEVDAQPPMLEVAAVPEPGTIGLLLFGVASLACRARRRRRRT